MTELSLTARFYCGLVSVEGKDPVYVFNGFFMQMRSSYTKPGASITYLVVEWPEDDLKWKCFRDELLGTTDPHDAPPDSARGSILAKWRVRRKALL